MAVVDSAQRSGGRRFILSGLRVIEFPAYIAAPLGGLTLAQMGADVIRIDPVGGNIDITRWPVNADGKSLYWASLNRGKRSIEIDVRRPEGRRLMRDLIRSGNGNAIFVTNLAVDGELSYDALAAECPGLIMVQFTGSPDGASALDYTVNCAVGFPSITGDATSAPVNHVLPVWDALAGATIAIAILAADRHRRDTGEGQLIRLSLSDVAMSTVSNLGYLAEAEVNAVDRQPDGNFVYGAYGDAFATADGRRVMVVAISNRQWRVLVDTVGVAADLETAAASLGHRLDSEGGRFEARALISAFFNPWFARRTLQQIAEAFAGGGVLWSPYRTFHQMLAEDPRCSEANPMFRRVAHPHAGTFLTATSPIDFGDAARVAPPAAPMLGQHSAEVLHDLLDMSDAQVAALVAAGIVGLGRQPASDRVDKHVLRAYPFNGQ